MFLWIIITFYNKLKRGLFLVIDLILFIKQFKRDIQMKEVIYIFLSIIFNLFSLSAHISDQNDLSLQTEWTENTLPPLRNMFEFVGTTGETFEYENVLWHEMLHDKLHGKYKIKFHAQIPNPYQILEQRGTLSIDGVTNEGRYQITVLNDSFVSLEKWLITIQKAWGPHYQINLIEVAGATCAVDLIPTRPQDTEFARFLAVDNRVIRMMTDDQNENRQAYFFNSFVKELKK